METTLRANITLDVKKLNRAFRSGIPVCIVIVLCLLAHECAEASIGKKTKNGRSSTCYNQVIGTSKFEPSGLVFSMIWGIIYLGILVIWAYGNWNLRKGEHVWRFNLIFGSASMLFAAWGVIIGLAGVGVIEPKSAHIASILVLITIIIHSGYSMFIVKDFLNDKSAETPEPIISINGSSIFSIIFVWAIVSTFLSITTPYIT